MIIFYLQEKKLIKINHCISFLTYIYEQIDLGRRKKSFFYKFFIMIFFQKLNLIK